MKKILLLSVLLSSFITVIAQVAPAPAMFSYQGVARNATGQPMLNQPISIQVTILNSASVSVYTGIYPATTDSLGLFSLKIGSVNPIQFGSITWSQGIFSIKVDMDPTGGNNFTLQGTPQQLLSVPFALYATLAQSSANDSDYVIYTGVVSTERLRVKQGGQTVSNRTSIPVGDVFSVYGTGSTGAIKPLGDTAIHAYVKGGGVAIIGENKGSGDGIWGESHTGTGVYGQTDTTNNVGVYGFGPKFGIMGVATSISGSAGGIFQNPSVTISGNPFTSWVNYCNGITLYGVTSNGTKSTIITDLSLNPRFMFCPEAPEVLFQDYGIGQLVNGSAHITIDPIFSKNIFVDSLHPIKVFVQLMGNCNGVYVANENPNGFDVIELNSGKSNAKFSWQIVANRADGKDLSGKTTSVFQTLRFPEGPSFMRPYSSSNLLDRNR